MNYKTYSGDAFVIGRRNFKEADRILILFTRDFGKISLIAKGVRKLTSRKRGGIEVFNKIKFFAVKGKNLDILTEVQMMNGFDEVRINLRRMSVGYYFCEVISRTTQEAEKHPELFEILEKYFNKLETSRNLKKLRLDFVKEVLVAIGFWPGGTEMINPDKILESVTERKMNSSRVGKKMLQQE